MLTIIHKISIPRSLSILVFSDGGIQESLESPWTHAWAIHRTDQTMIKYVFRFSSSSRFITYIQYLHALPNTSSI
jgi:hypothetical protein